jgi:hypothetical protein
MSMDMGASWMALSGLLGGSAQDDDGDNDVSFAPPTKSNFLVSLLPSTQAQNRFFSPHTQATKPHCTCGLVTCCQMLGIKSRISVK